jgi:hypothetical protein
MTFDPVIDPLKTLLLAAAAVALAVRGYCYGRQTTASTNLLLALRCLSAVSLALMLLNPVVSLNATASKKPPLFVLLDRSSSMAEKDEGSESRWERALRATARNDAFLQAAASTHELRLLSFSQGAPSPIPLASVADVQPAGEATDLAGAIHHASRSAEARPGGAILLVSDGRDTEDGSPIEASTIARRSGFPVATLCLGREGNSVDLRVRALHTEVAAAPGQTVQIAAEVSAEGSVSAPVRVDLLREGKRVQSKIIRVGAGSRIAQFDAREGAQGSHRYAIRAAALPAEADPDNNETDVLLRVSETRSRVLFLDGRPSWDSKFLLRTLREDPAVLADAIYRLTATKYFASMASAKPGQPVAIPKSLEALARYDALIVGRSLDEFYRPEDAEVLKRWVAGRGGALILLRGKPDDRLGALRDLEPVTWSDGEIGEARLRLTEDGQRHPALSRFARTTGGNEVRSIPPLVSATRVRAEKALSVVLARTETSGNLAADSEMAIIAHMRFGKGRVLAIAGQGLWRWAMAAPEQGSSKSAYAEFWSQMLRWLGGASDFLPGSRISIRVDRASYAVGDQVNMAGLVRPGTPIPPQVDVFGPGGRKWTLGTTRGDGKTEDFLASFRAAERGRYLVEARSAGIQEPVAAAFRVRTGRLENLNRGANPRLMKRIAEAGGGETLAPNRVADWARRLDSGVRNSRGNGAHSPEWPRWWFFAIAAGALLAEWMMRRRLGLR